MSTINATNIVTDALVGNTSANAITVRGEGSATTVLNQGLCKAFINFNGSNMTHRDSFNISGTTDLGVGNYQAAVTNGFASGSNWVTTGHAGNNSATNAGNAFSASNPHSSTSGHLETMNDAASNIDRGYIGMVYHGDLA